MVAIKNPLIEMEMDEAAAAYMGSLERQILGMTIQELRFRAVLELLTGEEWSDIAADLEAGEIEKIAVDAMQKKGIDRRKARRIVASRLKESVANATIQAAAAED